jgi:hypothetical protein
MMMAESSQGIVIPVWIARCERGSDLEHATRNFNLDEELTECAKEAYMLGNIQSEVKVDGLSVAKLEVRITLSSGTLDLKINEITNIT